MASEIYFSSELKKTFIAAFKAIFAVDTDFPYNNDDTLTSIFITPKFISMNVENPIPQVIFSTVSYGGEGEDTLNNNYSKDSENASGQLVNIKQTKIIRFQINIDVVDTNKTECEKVADKVFNILSHNYIKFIRDLGFNVRNIVVSECIPKEQFPQYKFLSTVVMQGDCRLNYISGPKSETDINILNSFKFYLETQ